ncbi:hypothetical protein GMOD_00005574 [Pyrenophora seminiperda CCB06]|uniref:Zn(2)-C6 fungal-type domain-containing protein n=1 Tax=Pyrenophora seminiperda CCB06 TaxID=1302712 RepID=A0A3M7M9K7_9PLEO|nr:hypothetical protein GMOD_00005574 [Pyrenophora seminiperda CCB06]
MGRCDQKLPVCGQCIKAGRACSGYRSTIDLMFRHESARVVSQNRRHKSALAAWDHNEHHMRLTRQTTTTLANNAPLKLTGFVMYQPLEDIGVNSFISNYTGDSTTSLLHHIPSVYAKAGGSTSIALPQMCTAMGLVTIASRSHNKDIFNAATKNYGAAIRAINAALLCPKKAAQDSVLASIYLAALFEAVIIPRHLGMDNCCTHLAGAVTVAHLIYRQERHTEATIEQCAALVKIVTMNSWMQGVPLPPNFVELKRLVRKMVKSVSVYDNFLDFVVDMLQFKQDFQDATKSNSMAIIERASAIDIALEDFSEALITEQMTEIVASVPQLADYVQDLELLSSRYRHTEALRGQRPSSERNLYQRYSRVSIPEYCPHSLYHILYQLYVYGTEPCLPQLMRDWIRERISCMEAKADPLDLIGLKDIAKQQLWSINPTIGIIQYVRHPESSRLITKKHNRYPKSETQVQSFTHRDPGDGKVTSDFSTLEGRLGGSNFLHREAVSAGGMRSCSSLACSICNI